MRACPRCGRENGEDVRFCGRCGLDLNLYAPKPELAAGEAAAHCYRHPKVETNLSCGRCERPVCTKCAIMGPAGIRCRECAKHKVPVRPGAVVHEAKRSLFSITRMGPYGMYMAMAVIVILLGVTRGCRAEAPVEEEAPAPEMSAPEGSASRNR